MKLLRKRNIIFAILLIFVAFLIFKFMGWITSNDVIDAAVDTDSGNISILYINYEIKTYSPNGELLYSVKLSDNDGGYATLEYVEGMLNIQMIRTNSLHILDNNGKIINRSVYDDKDENYSWDNGWQREKDAHRFYTETAVYQYNYPSYWFSVFSNSKEFGSFEIINNNSNNSVILD